jgi:polyhydroxybutyrate depolymerase
MRTAGLVFILSLLLAWFPPVVAAQLSAPLKSGNHTVTLTHENRQRSAIVHVPLRAAEKSRLPVVFNFHGGGGHGANQEEYSLMDQLADREGFVVVYPNGTGRLSNRLLTWNAGTCCAYAVLNHVDDVGFVLALIRRLELLVPIDRSRVYATGLSNGAMMSYRLAAEAGDHFAAIAPVAGGMVAPMIATKQPVPVMHFHSIDDPRALYHGGLGPPFPFTKSRVLHPDIDEMIARWVAHNGCDATPHQDPSVIAASASKQTATRIDYSRCSAGADVVLWRFTGVGHVWPGGKQNYLQRILGRSTNLVDANAEMWRFFLKFSLKPS